MGQLNFSTIFFSFCGRAMYIIYYVSLNTFQLSNAKHFIYFNGGEFFSFFVFGNAKPFALHQITKIHYRYVILSVRLFKIKEKYYNCEPDHIQYKK